jgi:hypothetical protein
MNNTLFIFNHLHLRILQDLIFNKKVIWTPSAQNHSLSLPSKGVEGHLNGLIYQQGI